MPMGLINALAIFIQIINNLFIDMLDKRVLAFLDGILIYSVTVKENLKFLEKVSTCLHKCMFYCKLKKCSFLQKTITLVGFDITPEGMHIIDVKV